MGARQPSSFLIKLLTWWQLLCDVVCCGSGKLCVLDTVDELHHGLGHLERLLIVAVAFSFLPLLQEHGLHLVLEDMDHQGHVQLVQAHLEEQSVKIESTFFSFAKS